jgi:hypothetical protein
MDFHSIPFGPQAGSVKRVFERLKSQLENDKQFKVLGLGKDAVGLTNRRHRNISTAIQPAISTCTLEVIWKEARCYNSSKLTQAEPSFIGENTVVVVL